MTDLLHEVYIKSTPIQRDDGNFRDYLVQNECNAATPEGGKKAGFDIHFRYDSARNQLTIQGPGAGSLETAHALLEAADRIILKLPENRKYEKATPLPSI